jgi:hypothetical protein
MIVTDLGPATVNCQSHHNKVRHIDTFLRSNPLTSEANDNQDPCACILKNVCVLTCQNEILRDFHSHPCIVSTK